MGAERRFIDSSSAPQLQRALESGIGPADQALLLDFEQVSFLSSAGLGIFLIFSRKFDAPGKQFGVCALSDSVRNVIAISGFDKFLKVYNSQAEAVNAFTSS
ncbi:MAG: STAS domain-containing protein [Candidatus Latescibacteria bacterium]|nr:STAS domain-containing protein [Candidatus Latescibacterota bacterium]